MGCNRVLLGEDSPHEVSERACLGARQSPGRVDGPKINCWKRPVRQQTLHRPACQFRRKHPVRCHRQAHIRQNAGADPLCSAEPYAATNSNGRFRSTPFKCPCVVQLAVDQSVMIKQVSGYFRRAGLREISWSCDDRSGAGRELSCDSRGV